MSLPDFSSIDGFSLTVFLFFIIITGRYFLVTGLFYSIFYLWFPDKWKQRKLNNKEYKKHQFRKEVAWSMVTAGIFSFAGAVTMVLWQKGYTKVYVGLNEYGWWYLPVSLIVFMLAHETYYYWLHRWMHNPKVFSLVHKVHHDSNITSPFTAFSFHPLEGGLQAIFLPVMLLLLPMHYYVVIVQLTIMTFSSVINHLNIEIYPGNFNKNFIGKWLIGATHHSLHHKQFKYNFGLYFTFWDKLKQTESPLYDNLFESTTAASNKDLNHSPTPSLNKPLTNIFH